MPWTDIGGNYHWGAGEPGWTAAPEPAPAPEAPLNLPMKPTYMAPPAPVAPPVAAPAAPPAPVAPLGPAISAGGPIGPIPITTGDKLASTLLPPPAHWLSQPKAKNNTLGNISISR